MKQIQVLSVFGTRPEAIKMCPLVKELAQRPEFNSMVCVTGQHRQMLDQVLDIFSVRPDYDLNIMKERQTLASITTGVVEGVAQVVEQCRPDIVLVHGDTTTSFAAALGAFYQKTPVGHVEAGLRTYNRYSPFPEEMNRTLTSRLAELHFAPTQRNAQALEKEGITQNVFVTGNTVIDAFATTVRPDYMFRDPALGRTVEQSGRLVLLTAHRRENLGRPLEQICDAVLALCEKYPDLHFVYPVHLNPAVRETVFARLGQHPRILLTQPLDVAEMHNVMARCHLVMTDSGGLQEEAPHLGKPVLVLRTETERPEAVEAGTALVVGVQTQEILRQASRLLDDSAAYERMAQAKNPYGDGQASRRIADCMLAYFQHKSNGEECL